MYVINFILSINHVYLKDERFKMPFLIVLKATGEKKKTYQ